MSENLHRSSASKPRYTREQKIQAVEYYVSYKITFVQTPITANIDILKADLKIKKASLKKLAKCSMLNMIGYISHIMAQNHVR